MEPKKGLLVAAVGLMASLACAICAVPPDAAPRTGKVLLLENERALDRDLLRASETLLKDYGRWQAGLMWLRPPELAEVDDALTRWVETGDAADRKRQSRSPRAARTKC